MLSQLLLLPSLATLTSASAHTRRGLLAAQKPFTLGDCQTVAGDHPAVPNGSDYPPWRERAPASDLHHYFAAAASSERLGDCTEGLGTAAVPLHLAEPDFVTVLCWDPAPHQARHRQQAVQQAFGRAQLYAEAALRQVSGSGLAQ